MAYELLLLPIEPHLPQSGLIRPVIAHRALQLRIGTLSGNFHRSVAAMYETLEHSRKLTRVLFELPRE